MSKIALVTGASRGIGRACAIKLAKKGFYVLVNYQSNKEAAEETLASIVEEGGRGEILAFNVADSMAVKEALEQWKGQNPDKTINVLVNNAGICKDNLMIRMPQEDWNNVIGVNLNGFFYLTQALVGEMLKTRWGRIINIASLSGIKGVPGQVNYSAAKAGVIGATKALAQEIAKRNVTVNAVAPGFIETDMTSSLNHDELKKFIPMGRFGKAEEVANVVAFLASEESSYITGEIISVTGGLS